MAASNHLDTCTRAYSMNLQDIAGIRPSAHGCREMN